MILSTNQPRRAVTDGRTAWALLLSVGLCALASAPSSVYAGRKRAAAAKSKASPPRHHSAAAVDPIQTEYEAAAAAAQAGRPVEAHDRLRRLLASTDADTHLTRAQHDAAQQILAAPLPAAGEVAVLGEPGTQVFIDDQPVGLLPLPLPLLLAAGAHQLAFQQSDPRHNGPRLSAQIQVRADRTLEVRSSRDAAAVLVSQPPHVLIGTSLASVPPDNQAALLSSIEQGLRRSRLAPLRSSTEVALQITDCKAQSACLAAIATRLEADYILLADVSPLPAAAAPVDPAPPVASDWKLHAQLIDGRVADVAAMSDEPCPASACAGSALSTHLRDLVSTVAAQGSSRQRGHLRVVCVPPDADIVLNGISAGRGPLDRTVWSGEMNVEASLAGYRPAQSRRFVADGGDERIEIALDRIPPPPPPTTGLLAARNPATKTAVVDDRAPRPKWRIAVGIGAMAGGAALAGFGAAALAVDGTCIDTAAAPARQCDRLYQTQSPGVGLVAAGAGLLLVGAVLWALPGPRRPHIASARRP